MSTSTATIYNQLANTASQQTALAELSPSPDTTLQLRNDLNAGSRVSVWRLFMWLFAYASKLQSDLFDRFKQEVVELAKDGHFGTRRWFAAKALKFQLGYTLTFTDNDAYYTTDDAAARIITHVAVVELANRVLVKVAKTQGSGLVKLEPAEALAVNEYFQELRPPVQVMVLTADPDRLRIYGTVIYNPTVSLFIVRQNVKVAIDNYLSSLEFGGAMRRSDLMEAILAANGVVDVQLGTVEARTQGPWNGITRIYTTYAGYMVLDPAYSINTTLSWQAGNL